MVLFFSFIKNKTKRKTAHKINVVFVCKLTIIDDGYAFMKDGIIS